MFGQSVLPACQGLIQAQYIVQSHLMEVDHKATSKEPESANTGLQTAIIFQTLTVADKALHHYKRAFPTSWKFTFLQVIAIQALTGGLEAGARKKFSNRVIRGFFEFSHQHLGKIAMLAAAVSFAILFAHGEVVYATVSLSWFAISSLAQSKLLPERVSNFILTTGGLVTGCAGLIAGGRLEKLISTVILTLQIIELRSGKTNKNEAQAKEEATTVVQFQDLPKFEKECTVNSAHLQNPRLPYIPEKISTKDLLDYCNTLLDVLNHDNWEQSQRLSVEKRNKLEALLMSLEGPEAAEVIPHHRVQIDYMCRYITSKFPTFSIAFKVQILNKLIAAADKKKEIEEASKKEMEDPATPLEEKARLLRAPFGPVRQTVMEIFSELAQFETRTLQEKVLTGLEFDRLKLVRGLAAICNIENGLDIVGKDFGLRHSNNNDNRYNPKAIINRLSKFISESVLGSCLSIYNERFILKNARQCIDESELREWWKSWMARNSLNEEQQKPLLEKLQANKFGLDSNPDADSLLRVTLAEMGVLTAQA